MKRETVIPVVVPIAVGLLTLFILLIHPFLLHPSALMPLFSVRCDVSEPRNYAVPGGGGYTLRYAVYYQEDCPELGSTSGGGVWARKSQFPWPWPETKYIFSYASRDSRAIDIIPTGPDRVTLSARNLTIVTAAETEWGTLKIDYNIGTINEPRPTDPVVTGAAWADKQQRLEQYARSQGIRLIGSESPK
jgi:hypothetical protein